MKKVYVYETDDGQIMEFNNSKEMMDFVVKQVLGDNWYIRLHMNDGKTFRVVQ